MEEKDYSGPYQQLQEWVLDRVDQWEEHRNSNYQSKWDEYYRIWRGIWSASDKTRTADFLVAVSRVFVYRIPHCWYDIAIGYFPTPFLHKNAGSWPCRSWLRVHVGAAV